MMRAALFFFLSIFSMQSVWASDSQIDVQKKDVEIFKNLNLLAFYIGSTIQYDNGFYVNCVSILAANGFENKKKFVHCNGLNHRFIKIPKRNITFPHHVATRREHIDLWLSTLNNHEFNLKKVENDLNIYASEYQKQLDSKKIIENHMEPFFFSYGNLDWEYSEITDWSQYSADFDKQFEPVKKLIATVVKRAVLAAGVYYYRYEEFLRKHNLQQIDATIDLSKDEYRVCFEEMQKL